jgi:hypothetical protein
MDTTSTLAIIEAVNSSTAAILNQNIEGLKTLQLIGLVALSLIAATFFAKIWK